MSETRPIGEQLRFVSSKTGSHNLDTYLEAAEPGTRTLADVVADLWDPVSGLLRNDRLQLRINTSGLLQQRLGDFANPDAGWTPVTGGTVFVPRDIYAQGTSYNRLDLVTHASGTWIARTAHTASTPAPNPALWIQILTTPFSTSANIPFVPAGAVAATNVQAAIQELDAEKAPVSHTHLTAQLADSTALGRSLVTVANDTAARVLIDAARTTHGHLADQITDSTAVGRAVLTAADQNAARQAMLAAPTRVTRRMYFMGG